MEGGQRVPFVVRWPNKVPASSSCSELATSMDLLPTFAKLAGAQLPDDRKIDGKDIWPLLSGAEGAKTPHDAFYYYFRGRLQAVRSGDWKLRLPHKARNKQVEEALFNLKEDIAEEKNVIADRPVQVAKLRELAKLIREDIGDDETGAKGANTRPAGFKENASPLTSND